MLNGTVNMETSTSIPTGKPSPIIWGDCPVDQIAADPSKGVHVFEDFHSGVIAGSTLTLGQRFPGWVCYAESNGVADCALQSDAAGVLMLDQDGTDDDVTTLTSGDNVTGMFTITSKQDTGFWYEARFKVSTITDGDLATFIGLTEEGQAADGKPLGAVGAIGDIDHIGFNIKEDDGDSLDVVYTKSGETDGGTADIDTLVADTYVQVGLKYESSDNKVHVYVDGVEDKDAAIDCTADAFPSGEKLALTAAIASGANGADSDNIKIDWIRCAQTYRV